MKSERSQGQARHRPQHPYPSLFTFHLSLISPYRCQRLTDFYFVSDAGANYGCPFRAKSRLRKQSDRPMVAFSCSLDLSQADGQRAVRPPRSLCVLGPVTSVAARNFVTSAFAIELSLGSLARSDQRCQPINLSSVTHRLSSRSFNLGICRLVSSEQPPPRRYPRLCRCRNPVSRSGRPPISITGVP